jgi:two-component system, chemotaxis family, sensor kinase CheA
MTLDAEMMEIARVFFQESREGLDAMEAGLLGLDNTSGSETINTIFRAAHSIKGGAATFGYAEVAGFTHGVETLLDDMRKGTRSATPEAIRVLLKACDCLREMIAATEASAPLDQVRITTLNADIERILADDSGATAQGLAAALPAVSQPPAPAISRWKILFEPVRDLLKLRNEPTRMFAELERLGTLVVRTDFAKLPALEAIEPEDCYLAWELEVEGPIQRRQIDDIFDWVDAGCRLEIVDLNAVEDKPDTAPTVAPSIAALPRSQVPSAGPSPSPPTAPSGRMKSGAESASIRVATDKLDSIINLVGELLITQSMLATFAQSLDVGRHDMLRKGLSQLARNTRELQDSVMQVRMLPISFAFNRFPRLVHDLSQKLGKSVAIKLSGENTELDKTVLEKISDPLVHLVRNSLDHGLETPEMRLAAGKSATGTLELVAFHEGGSIIIEVRDDGAGLNRQRILTKARERGIVSADQELNDEQIDNLIFMPGFSTADQVSDVSGRGVGMDVVRRNINDLGGHVQIHSAHGQGSTVRIRLPLTLAILDGQLVRVGKETYIISLLSIVETILVSRQKLNSVLGGFEVFRLREEYLPIIRLADAFGIEPDDANSADGLLVIVEADNRRVCLMVDDLLAQQQVVIKSIDANFKPVPGIAGATILGDGAVALIIDVRELVRPTSTLSTAAPARAA